MPWLRTSSWSPYAAAYETVGAALADLDAIEQLHKDEMIGQYDAAVIDKENRKPHVVKPWPRWPRAGRLQGPARRLSLPLETAPRPPAPCRGWPAPGPNRLPPGPCLMTGVSADRFGSPAWGDCLWKIRDAG